MDAWSDIVAAYARPGVKAACLDLQNQYGHCVCYLLWAGWAAREGRFADPRALAGGVDLCRAMEAEALAPARARLAAARGSSDVDDQAKARAAAASLEAERRLVLALEARTPPESPNITVAAALDAAVAAWGGVAPAKLLVPLAAAFSRP